MKCIFCELIEKKANMLFEDEKVVVMLSPEPAVAGHLVILPKQHIPILEQVPDFVVGEMFKAANKAGIVIFEALGAHGTNIIIQNGPSAGQTHPHAMIHVLPRFEEAKLQIGWTPQKAEEEELSEMESKIKDESKNVGVFEKEKQKPIEVSGPEEFKEDEEDYRLKQLRRIP